MVIVKGGVIDFFCRLIKKYFEDNVNNTAAALAYYMFFSFFPIMVGFSMMLGFAHIDITAVTNAAAKIMPAEVVSLISRYLVYVRVNKSGNIMAVSLFFTIFFPVRAANFIMLGIDKAYGSENRRNFIVRGLLVIAFAMILIFTVVASLFLLAAGRNILDFLSGVEVIIPIKFIDIWVYLRFVIMAVICSVAITALYCLAPNEKVRFKEALPGAVSAVSCWIIISALFSFYVENMGKYSAFFGSIGAIIVLLIWLYMTAMILIMGAEVNSVLISMKNEDEKQSIKNKISSRNKEV